jgi:DNA polymerase-3 subunit delta
MSASPPGKSDPTIYLLNGQDEFSIAQFISGLQATLGDPGQVMMNLTRLDGRSATPEDLRLAANAMPFLSSRRLVILEHPTARVSTPDARQKWIVILEKIPPTTCLVLVEYKALTEKRNRDRRLHWLEEWAFGAGEHVNIKRFDLPPVEEMSRWILARSKVHGGQFTRSAANALADLVGNDVRTADLEIQKLLTYVDYRRAVEQEDVRLLTVDLREGDIFALVDALSSGNINTALAMLERLLEEQEPIAIFAMIVRQYRLLLQARQVLDRGGNAAQVAREVVDSPGRAIHPYVAEKVARQAGRYALPVLELIYHHLLSVDEAMKTSQVPPSLALETLVVRLGSLHPVYADPEMIG